MPFWDPFGISRIERLDARKKSMQIESLGEGVGEWSVLRLASKSHSP